MQLASETTWDPHRLEIRYESFLWFSWYYVLLEARAQDPCEFRDVVWPYYTMETVGMQKRLICKQKCHVCKTIKRSCSAHLCLALLCLPPQFLVTWHLYWIYWHTRLLCQLTLGARSTRHGDCTRRRLELLRLNLKLFTRVRLRIVNQVQSCCATLTAALTGGSWYWFALTPHTKFLWTRFSGVCTICSLEARGRGWQIVPRPFRSFVYCTFIVVAITTEDYCVILLGFIPY